MYIYIYIYNQIFGVHFINERRNSNLIPVFQIHDSLSTGSLHYVIPMGIAAAVRYDFDKPSQSLV